MHDRLRWGILGTGNIARQFATGVLASARGRLAAVGSRSEQSARQFAASYAIPAAVGAYGDLIQCAEVDAVYVALPNSMHHEWTIRALEAGKHVLCEKPFATSLAQAQEMFDVARQRGRVLIEAFMYRAHPLTRAIVEKVRSGAIGEVRLIRSSFCFKVSKWQQNIRFDPAMHGGVMMDVGCYCLSFSRLFAGAEPSSIQVLRHLHEAGVDDLVAGTLAFPNGILASFSCGFSAHADNTSSICGSEGFIEIPVPWKPPGSGAVFTIGRSIPPKMDNPQSGLLPMRETFIVNAGGDLYGHEADAFAAAVMDGAAPFVPEAETLGNQRALDELRRQIRAMA